TPPSSTGDRRRGRSRASTATPTTGPAATGRPSATAPGGRTPAGDAQPSFFVYQETYHRCPGCGHRQGLIPPFKRRDVKYTFRFEQHVVTSLIGSTAEDVAGRLGISAETVERIVKNVLDDGRGKVIDPTRRFERLGMDEI